MKKIIISLMSLFTVSTTTTSLVSCAAPTGNEIHIAWVGKTSDQGSDPFLVDEVILPLYNMLNSTPESRKQSNLPNDGMTKEQIDNTLASKTKSLESVDIKDKNNGKNIWSEFFQSWNSSQNFSYNSITIQPTSSSDTVSQITNWNPNTKKDETYYTTSLLSTTYKSLAVKKEQNGDQYYLNLSSDTEKLNALTFTFNFNDEFTFQVNITNLIADFAVVNTNAKDNPYQAIIYGYSFIDPTTENAKTIIDKHYLLADKTTQKEISKELSVTHLGYNIIPDSIKPYSTTPIK